MTRTTKLSELNIYDFGHDIQLVGCLYAGKGRSLLAMLPGESHDGGEIELLDLGPGDWEALLRQTDLLEVEVSVRRPDGSVAKAIARKSARQVETALSWRVFRRDRYACRYCGLDEVPLTVDHLVCWEDFGPSIEANMVAACRPCNKTRGNLAYPDWLRHPHYLQVSRRLTEDQRQANARLVDTLDRIPRVGHVRSHR